MSSVSDQLQRSVGKSRDTAVRGDKEMCEAVEERRNGDRQRGKKKRGGIIRARGADDMDRDTQELCQL